MHPFASLRRRNQAWANGDLSFQQVLLLPPSLPPSISPSSRLFFLILNDFFFPWLGLPTQTHSIVPPWSIPGPYNADSSRSGPSNIAAAAAFPGLMPPLSCPNLPPMMQNNQPSVLPTHRLQFAVPRSLNEQRLAPQLCGLSHGAPGNLQQFQGQLQNRNVVNLLQPGVSFLTNNLPQKFNWEGAMPNVYSLLPQKMMIHENQIGDRNSHALSQPQVLMFEVTGRVIEPKSCPRKRVHKDVIKHKQTEPRCRWKQLFKKSKSMKTNTETTGGIVVKKRRERKSQRAMNIQSSLKDSQRRRPIKYTGKKIQQWVKARRKNFPARLKTEKQPKEALARQAGLGVQVPKLPRRCRSRPKVVAGTKVHGTRALKMTNQVPNKEAESGALVGEVSRGSLYEPNHQNRREANNPEMLKMTVNVPNKSNKKRKRNRKRPSVRMVDSSRELKMTDQFPNKSNQVRKTYWLRERKPKVEQ